MYLDIVYIYVHSKSYISRSRYIGAKVPQLLEKVALLGVVRGAIHVGKPPRLTQPVERR